MFHVFFLAMPTIGMSYDLCDWLRFGFPKTDYGGLARQVRVEPGTDPSAK
jgi:hypothetical protein